MAADIKDLIGFNKICDEFIAGKYILADIKISSVLKTIAEQEKIRNIVASCTDRYDFNSAYKKAVTEDKKGGKTLILPTDDASLVAFIFGLLYRMDNKTIDLYNFLTDFFHEDNAEAGKEFINFTNDIIVPFKKAINNIYSSRHIVVDSNDYQTNYFNKIMSTIQLIIKNADSYRLKMNEKEEFTILLNSLNIACEKNDKKQVFALMIGIDYFTKVNKRSRPAYQALEDCFAEN